jgi:general secretion pathway protein L
MLMRLPAKLDIRRPAQVFRAWVTAATHWWLSELAAMIPAAIKRAVIPPSEVTVIHIERGNAIVRRFDRDNKPTEIRRTLLEELDAKSADTSRPALVALEPDVAYADQFKVPLAAQGRLRQAVSFEVARRSPFRGPDAVFDYHVAGRSDDNRILDIEWATVPANLIQNAQMVSRRLGYFPAAIGLAPAGHSKLRFVFVREKPAFSVRLTRATVCLGLSLALLTGSLTASAYHRFDQAAANEHAAAMLKDEAGQAQKTKATAEAMEKAIAAVAQRMAEPKALDILRAITDALPDDTWVSEFSLNANQVRLAGFSASASALPERLAPVPLFEHPQFRAAITPQPGKNVEHFDLGLAVPKRHAAGEAN